MIRTAVYFGLWATICMALAITCFVMALGLPIEGRLSDLRDSLGLITFLAAFSPAVGTVASLGWVMFHRKGRQPVWWGYARLAIGVAMVSHVLVFGSLNIGWWWPDLSGWIVMMGILFAMHGWLSVPVALAATALCVFWNRRCTGTARA